MLDVRRLRLLRELALRGTIAAVAEALAFTPSAVSQQLSVLEREAGVSLLERTGRRVTLTPAGQRLALHAEAVLERLELAAAELVDARQGLAGPLRIGTFPTAARALLPAALVALAVEHPRLEPMVSEMDPAAVAHALRAGELDVALVHDYDFVPALAEPGVATEPLCTEAMYLAATAPPAGVTPCAAPAPRGTPTTDHAPHPPQAPRTPTLRTHPHAHQGTDTHAHTPAHPQDTDTHAHTQGADTRHTPAHTPAPAPDNPAGTARTASTTGTTGTTSTPNATDTPNTSGTATPASDPVAGSGLGRWRDAPWITATPGTLCHAMTVRACQAAGFTPRVRHQIDEFATVLALVAAGQGVALVPELGLVHPPPQVALVPVPMSRRTKVAFRSGAGRHPAVTAVLAALQAAVAHHLPATPGALTPPTA